MTYKLCILLAGLLSWGARPAVAQQPGRSEAATAEQRIVEDLGPTWPLPVAGAVTAQNLADIVQRGNGNVATSTQQNAGALANQAFIEQVGDVNQAYLSQQGSGNTTRITQNGRNNLARSEVVGDRNTTTLVQNGNDNFINRQLQSTGEEYKLVQQGNNNKLDLRGSSPALPQGYSVEMRGNGIQLTIEQSRSRP